jgi:hypothetical protein
MDHILGERRFVEVPGGRNHELPPLLVRTGPNVRRLDRIMNMATNIVEDEDMVAGMTGNAVVPEDEMDRRRMDLAVNLVDQYMALLTHWQWGDSILEWIRQCEMTFESRVDLRNLIRSELWPHAGRSSFVQLLEDKSVPTPGVQIEKAVGLRLSFRQPPPISCFSNQFLFYLNGRVASTAYQTWMQMTPQPVSALPPERFTFRIVNMSLD